jgi:hypothetical protein
MEEEDIVEIDDDDCCLLFGKNKTGLEFKLLDEVLLGLDSLLLRLLLFV